MAAADIPKPAYAHNMRAIGHSDQGGRPDAVQVMVNKGHAYVSHLFSNGFSVIDVRDPKNPKAVGYFPCPENTWNLHCQTHDDLLLVVHAKNMWAQPELADERNYYKGKTDFHAQSEAKGKRNWSAGMAVYDISKPAAAEADRFHADRRRRHPPHLVRRRTLGLCLGADRRFFRLHLHHHRHGRSDEAARGRTLLAAGHEPRRRREDQLADRERPLWLPSRRRARRHRLLRLARRQSRGGRREGSRAIRS